MPLLWFRRRKKQDEPAGEPATPLAAPAPPTDVEPTAAEPETAEAAARKRRRGTRGGRNRRRPSGRAAADTGAADAAEEAKQEKPEKPAAPQRSRQRSGDRPQRERSDRSRGSARSSRRRSPTRRAPLPPAKRELLVSAGISERRVAVLEDGKVAEVYLERPERRSIAGNIYLGTVDNVLPGMEAAFVDIGLEKNGFLYVDEIVTPELEGRRHGKRIQDLLSRGQTLLVQAVKDPMKSKGARLTTEISLPGRFVVYVPSGEGFGVSRRLEDDERSRLRDILKGLDVKKGGLIVRTAAEGASAEDIERDFEFLLAPLEDDRAAGEEGGRTDAHLPGGGAASARHARPLHRGLRARARRRRSDVPAHRRLPEEDVPAHGRTRRPSPEQAAADGGVRRRRRDQVHAVQARRPAFGRLPDLRLRRGVHRRRREHRPLRRLPLQDVDADARGHDHQEQHRGGQGGRAPAAAARHRRDHRHRLHRHGEPEEPCHGGRDAAAGARARPDEDLRRRDLAARSGRDDAPERLGRAPRDPRQEVPDVCRRRDRGLRDDCGRRARAAAAHARARFAQQGLPGRGERPRGEHPDRARRAAARRPGGSCKAALRDRRARGRGARPPRGARARARRPSPTHHRSPRAASSASSSSRSASTTRARASPSTTASRSPWQRQRRWSARRSAYASSAS